jgi:hypothetical protein
MKYWEDRSHEERNLLNPAFCSTILWHAGKGATGRSVPPRQSLSFIEAFLILPIVLHRSRGYHYPKGSILLCLFGLSRSRF